MTDALRDLLILQSQPTPAGRTPLNPLRDQAIIGWMTGTPCRIAQSLTITTYEIPAIDSSTAPFVPFHLPAATAKYKRAVEGLGFINRIARVHRAVNGERRFNVLGTRWKPHQPLRIVRADSEKVTWHSEGFGESTRRWDDVTAEQRRRLVNPDGTTPILFVSTTGTPLKEGSTIRKAIKPDREWVARHGPMRPHDLRHTFATHLAFVPLERDEDLLGTAAAEVGQAESVTVTTGKGDLVWIADAVQVEERDQLDEGQSQVDTTEFTDTTVSGTATFYSEESLFEVAGGLAATGIVGPCLSASWFGVDPPYRLHRLQRPA